MGKLILYFISLNSLLSFTKASNAKGINNGINVYSQVERRQKKKAQCSFTISSSPLGPSPKEVRVRISSHEKELADKYLREEEKVIEVLQIRCH